MTRLNERALHEAAAQKTQLSDFGTPDYLPGLRQIIAAASERPASSKLDALIENRVLHSLVGRLHSQHGWQQHPAYRQSPIVAPIIITGMSRSGTSALHQLLAADEQFQWIPHWIAERPTVRPLQQNWLSSSAYRVSDAELADDRQNTPEMRKAHNVEAALPEECINVMCQSFISMMFITTMPLPRYREWFFRQDETGSYQRYADNLRLIGLEDGGERAWLLKNPSHTGAMQALLRVFPDARIIVTHRDPVAAVSSAVSLTNIVSGDLWEPGEAARTRLEVGLHNVTRLQAARELNPDNFHDVDYRQFVADPMGVVRGIYSNFGLTLGPTAEARMRTWIADNPQGKFGQHQYQTDAMGIDADEIRRRFADYIRRYRLN